MKTKSWFLNRKNKHVYYRKHELIKYLGSKPKKQINRPELLEMLTHGYCDIFAIAAHELTGLQLLSIHEKRTVGSVTADNALVHAYLLLPDRKRMFDARGIIRRNTFLSEFKITKSAYVKIHRDGKYLLDMMTETNQQKQRLLKEAKRLIKQFYYPIRHYIRIK